MYNAAIIQENVGYMRDGGHVLVRDSEKREQALLTAPCNGEEKIDHHWYLFTEQPSFVTKCGAYNCLTWAGMQEVRKRHMHAVVC